MNTLSTTALASAIALALAGCDAGRDDQARKTDVERPATTAGAPTSPPPSTATTPPTTTTPSTTTPSTATGPASTTTGAAGKPADTKVGQKVDDTVITSKVKTALMADPDIKGTNINVDTMKGEVKLSGTVKSEAQVQKAMEITRGVEGVTGVQNNLQVKSS
jgi:hyperosmotically inducible protein